MICVCLTDEDMRGDNGVRKEGGKVYITKKKVKRKIKRRDSFISAFSLFLCFYALFRDCIIKNKLILGRK